MTAEEGINAAEVKNHAITGECQLPGNQAWE